MVLRLLILAEVSLYREMLARSLGRDDRFDVAAVAAGINEALAGLEAVRPDIIVVDAGMPASANAVLVLATAAPEVKVVALGVPEVEVMALAEAGVSGYVSLDGSMEDLAAVVESVARGETLCSPGIAGTLFQRVATLARERELEPVEEKLTAREIDVLRLIEEGRANKEIATALSIELPTVKNHVHNILEKLNVHRRTEAAARARRDGLPRLGDPGSGPRN
jgi:two-component system nitrate/nitrite response regulator NarL